MAKDEKGKLKVRQYAGGGAKFAILSGPWVPDKAAFLRDQPVDYRLRQLDMIQQRVKIASRKVDLEERRVVAMETTVELSRSLRHEMQRDRDTFWSAIVERNREQRFWRCLAVAALVVTAVGMASIAYSAWLLAGG